MRSKKYVIQGMPLTWKRPGYNSNAQTFYNTQRAERIMFGYHLSHQHNDEPLFDKPLHIDILFYMPKSSNKSKASHLYCATAPDIDNLIKHVLDSAQGVILTNDYLVSSVYAKKIYDKYARTEFIVTELHPSVMHYIHEKNDEKNNE